MSYGRALTLDAPFVERCPVEVTGNAELAGIAAEVAAALDEAMRSLSPA